MDVSGAINARNNLVSLYEGYNTLVQDTIYIEANPDRFVDVNLGDLSAYETDAGTYQKRVKAQLDACQNRF